MKSPLLILAACFAAGIFTARLAAPTPLSVGFLLAFAAISLLAALVAARSSRFWPAILSTLVGFVLAGAAAQGLFPYRFPLNHIAHFAPMTAQPERTAVVDGVMVTSPLRTPEGLQFDLQVNEVESGNQMRPATGRLRLELRTPARATSWESLDRLHLQYGDAIRAPVRLYKPRVYRNPGSFNYRWWLASIQDIEWEGIIARPELIQKVQGHHAPAASFLIHRVRERLLHAIDGLFPPWAPEGRDGAVLKAMLLGDRSSLDSQTIENFRRSGLYHLLVIAGLHVGLLIALFYGLLRLFRLREFPTLVCLVLFLIGYSALVEERAATMRATLMILSYLLARFLYRERSSLNAVGMAALILLAVRPAWLFEAGFQFSFAAALVIAALALPILSRVTNPYRYATRQLSIADLDIHLQPKQAQFRVDLRRLVRVFTRRFHFLSEHPGAAERLVTLPTRWILKAWAWVVFCFALQIGVLLPMASIFNRVTPVGFLLNIAALPVMTVLLGLAVPTVVLAAAVPLLAVWPAKVLTIVMSLLFWLTENPHMPHWFSYRVPGPPAWVAWGFGLALVAASLALGRSRRSFAISCMATGVFAVLISVCPFPTQIPRDQIEMTALDCGRGESVFVVLPDRTTMLLGAGGVSSSPGYGANYRGRWDPGENILSPYLWSRRIKAIDVLVLTSAGDGALEGMDAIARNFRVREFWYPAGALQNPHVGALLDEFGRRGIRLREMSAGESAERHGVDVLWPPSVTDDSARSADRGGLVLSIRRASDRLVVFDGLNAEGLASLANSGADLEAEVFESTHWRESEDLLRQAQPRVFVLTGSNRSEADSAAFERLPKARTAIFSTGEDGAVMVDLQGPTVRVRCDRACGSMPGEADARAAGALTFRVR